MSTWSCNQQVCASCRYWCGRREIDFMANFFDAMVDKGICAGPSGSFRGVETSDATSCGKWEAFRNER